MCMDSREHYQHLMEIKMQLEDIKRMLIETLEEPIEKETKTEKKRIKEKSD